MNGAPVAAPYEDGSPVPFSSGPRSPHDALAWAHNQIGIPGWSGMCLSFVRTGYNLPGVYASAADAWDGAEHRHTTGDWRDIPEGAPVFMFDGKNPDEHVAFNDGGGYMVTTNSGTGYPVRQSYDLWASWGYRPHGWTEDLNGYYVCDPDGSSETDNGEVVNVPYDFIGTHDRHTVKADSVWTPVYVADDNGQTLISSPGAFAASVNVYVEDLPKGAVGKLRFIAVDTEDNGADPVQVADYPIVEFHGTSGQTAAQVVQFGNLGKSTTSGKPSRRLRAQILVESPDPAYVTFCSARWFH